jgi:hypothetical protein
MKWLLCRWWGHDWRCQGVTMLDQDSVMLWVCARCGKHEWREMKWTS